MAISISKRNAEILSSMVLSRVVIARESALALEHKDANRFDIWARETVVEYALNVALGMDDDGRQLAHVKEVAGRDDHPAQSDAYVAMVRLERLGRA